MLANLRKEFSDTPIKTLGSLVALAVAIGSTAWALLNLVPGVLPAATPAWTPIYFLGAALGVGFALLGLAGFRLGALIGCVLCLFLLYCLADSTAWLIAVSRDVVGDADLWITGIAAYVAFWAVLIQTAVQVAQSGKYEEFGIVVFLITIAVVPALGLAFAGIVSLNLPGDLQFITFDFSES